MDWYYSHEGRQLGPVSEQEFQKLVQLGTISPQTLVWREGLPQWTEYRTAVPSPVAPPTEPPLMAPPPVMQPTPPPDHVRCLECRRFFPPDAVTPVAGFFVCAACKSLWVQKLREGLPLFPVAGDLVLAEFWQRALAFIIDGIITYFLQLTVIIPFMMLTGAVNATGASSFSLVIALQLFVQLVSTLIYMTYHVFFLYRFSATPGKMLFRLAVVRADGSRLTLGRCFGRFFATWLSSLTCCIGYLLPLADEQRRALHDYICDTRVIKRPHTKP